MNDVRRDWNSWSKVEQVAVTLIALVSLVVVVIGPRLTPPPRSPGAPTPGF